MLVSGHNVFEWYLIMNKKHVFPLLLTTLFSFGCSPTVKVEAPDKPITINLNVNVEHKLKVQVDKDLDTALKDNPDLF